MYLNREQYRFMYAILREWLLVEPKNKLKTDKLQIIPKFCNLSVFNLYENVSVHIIHGFRF